MCSAGILPVGARTFACAFGYGRTLLNPGTFEEHFGLKVTLNCVDPSKVHSIDRTTLDTISRHSQIQASHLAPIGKFGLDVEQDPISETLPKHAIQRIFFAFVDQPKTTLGSRKWKHCERQYENWRRRKAHRALTRPKQKSRSLSSENWRPKGPSSSYPPPLTRPSSPTSPYSPPLQSPPT